MLVLLALAVIDWVLVTVAVCDRVDVTELNAVSEAVVLNEPVPL